MTHLFNWKEWLSFVSVFRFQVSSHECNCKNNTVENLPRTMEILRIYTCRENLLHDVAVRGNLQPWTDQGSCDLPIYIISL